MVKCNNIREEQIKIIKIMLIYRLWRRQKKRKQRKFYVRPLNISRFNDGEFYKTVKKMRQLDPAKHFEYFRMDCASFDSLLELVAPFIYHKPNHKLPVGPDERLAVTLR